LAHAALAAAMPTGKIIGAKAKTPFVHNGFKRTENNRAVRKKYFPVPFCPRDEILTSFSPTRKL
jgi:hypothetical protein